MNKTDEQIMQEVKLVIANYIMYVALLEDRPHIPFLSGWLGSDTMDGCYEMAREYLDADEHAAFDTRSDDETQRTFLYLVAAIEGADCGKE